MNFAFAYSTGDHEAAARWLTHLEQWDQSNHNLFVMAARGAPEPPSVKAWHSVTILKDGLGVKSNWNGPQAHRSAAGPNSMFRQFARYFYQNKLGPWTFIEPDCIPLRNGWADQWEAEYIAGGKPYMGALVQVANVPAHCTGNMVCPENAAQETTIVLPVKAADGNEIAFDIACARHVLRQCHFTPLIQHVFRAPSFTSQADFDQRVSKDAVLYHACKEGSIFKYLGGPVSAVSQGMDGVTIVPSLTPASPLTDNVVDTIKTELCAEAKENLNFCPVCGQPVFGSGDGPCMTCLGITAELAKKKQAMNARMAHARAARGNKKKNGRKAKTTRL